MADDKVQDMVASSSNSGLLGKLHIAGVTYKNHDACLAILNRLKELTGANNDRALAEKLGLAFSSVSSAKTRQMIPSAWLLAASQGYNARLEWLTSAEGDKFNSDSKPLAITASFGLHDLELKNTNKEDGKKRLTYNLRGETRYNEVKIRPDDEQSITDCIRDHYTLIPKVAPLLIQSSHNIGFEYAPGLQADIITWNAYRKEWLSRWYSGPDKANNMFVVKAMSDCLAPEMYPDDLVIVSKVIGLPSPNEIYAIIFDRMITFRRLNILGDGSWVWEGSEKRGHPVIYDREGATRLLGRAVWWCHEHFTPDTTPVSVENNA
jgi:Predicted transcriptional regulator